jgi:DNA polymerase III epsilon subunit-like protein
MKKSNILFFDFETSGLSGVDSIQITQVAAVGINGQTLQFTKNDIFSSMIKIELDEEKCKEQGLEAISQKVLDLTHLTKEQLAAAPDEKTVYDKFKKFIARYSTGTGAWGKPIASGFNIRNYDMPLLDVRCQKYGDYNEKWRRGNLFHPSTMLDLKDLEYLTLENIPSITSISFDNLRKLYGLETDAGSHDARVDVIQGSLLLCKKLAWLRKLCSKSKFEGSMADARVADYM